MLSPVSYAAVLVALTTLSEAAAPVINLQYGKFQGGQDTTLGINYYYGLRFAAPPTGDNRWRAPVDIEGAGYYPKNKVTNASTHGPACFQGYPGWIAGAGGVDLNGQSEDCLLLDVVVPTNPKSKKLPVIVQIHGGGYTLGSATSYPGENLVSYSNGQVIWFDVQYRLGAFGFLSNTDIQDDGSPNAGLLDQRAALGWVQRHAAAFGGDPSKVTIWGGSAGGGSVMNQMIMYGGQANPPFRAVISEYPWWQNYHNQSSLDLQYDVLSSLTNCTSLVCLRGVSTEVLAEANSNSFATGYAAGLYGHGDFWYGPSVDGSIIRDLPSNEFKQGHFTNVPLLVDRDAFEGIAFSNDSINVATENTPDLRILFPYAQQSFFGRLYELYPYASFDATFFANPLVEFLTSANPAIANNPAFWQLALAFGDYIIQCPTYYMGTAASDAGMPVWKLVFNAGSELHAATYPYLFPANSASNNETLSMLMKDYFLSFAIALDPNAKGFGGGVQRPQWPQYAGAVSTNAGQVSSFQVLEINATSIMVMPDPDASDRCDFFHAQSYVVRN